MANGYVKVSKTTEGKFYGQVRLYNGKTDKAHYETPEYVTAEMAHADAACWKAFHMTDEAPKTTVGEFTIDADDTVYGRSGMKMTGAEFTEHLKRVNARVTKVEYRVYPFTQSTKKGFHLDIVYPGNAPTRKFTVHKAN